MSGIPLTESERLVPTTPRSRTVARVLAVAMLLFFTGSLLMPWQQSVDAEGRVLSLAPSDRKQTVEAPVSGQIVRWLVRDGVQVEAGEPLVEIGDNDPRLLDRLRNEREALIRKRESYRAQVGVMDDQRVSLAGARDGELRAAEAKRRAQAQKLTAQRQKLQANDAALETAMLQLGRVRALAERGLSAFRDRELAELAATKARTERDAAAAELSALEGELEAATAALDKARNEGDAKLHETSAKQRSGETDLADTEVSLLRLDVAIARQERQLVRAPCRGIVVAIHAFGTGVQVKQGDQLATLVPTSDDRAVELFLDGNDAAIVNEGRPVRLQFEGFPALQFSGWPATSFGTFGGVVRFIDLHADEQGRFRVLVAPDGVDRWPPARFLRQGLRVRGWVLLEQVKVGFELWRRWNDFPPALQRAPTRDEGPVKGAAK